MSTQWGPQATGGVTAPPRKQSDNPWWGAFTWGSLLVMPLIYIALAILNHDPCDPIGFSPVYSDCQDQRDRTDPSDTINGLQGLLTAIWWSTLVIGALMGFWDGWRRERFARGHWLYLIVLIVLQRQAIIAYAVAFFAAKVLRIIFRVGRGTQQAVHSRKDPATSGRSAKAVVKAPDPLLAIRNTAARTSGGQAGAHLGWSATGEYRGIRPRVAALVIAPPGAGKTAGQLIPTIIVSPFATVVSSVRSDVLEATVGVRRLVGRCWHFDPGGAGTTFPEVWPVRWSPLVGIRNWDDARLRADRLVEAVRKPGSAQGSDGDHFIDRARDWIEVLLFAAALADKPIGQVADWAARPDSEDVQVDVDEILLHHKDVDGAQIAATQHMALQEVPDRERGSIKSTMTRILRIYSSTAARNAGYAPNFDPQTFIRSSDTLYITAPSERQKEYAPLIAGLLQEIRYATYERARREREGLEPELPHVTFVLDEANNTAPIPLPEIVSEAGGSKLHVVVAIQDLSRARNRWGREADGFLTLFSTKVVHPGVVEDTINLLSAASGEYDRLMTSVSESTSYTPGPNPRQITHVNPSYNVQTRRVLTPGDIAKIPPGTALVFTGAEHELVTVGMYWQHPAWQAAITFANNQPPTYRPEPPAISISGARPYHGPAVPFAHSQHPVIDGHVLPPNTPLPRNQ